MNDLENYELAHQAFQTGSVLTDSNEALLIYLSGLSNQRNINQGTQHRDVIRGLTINNILLQRHITTLQAHISDLDRKNQTTNFAVIALSIAAVIGTGLQTWYGYKADRKSEAEAKATAVVPQMQALSMATPYVGAASIAPPSKQGSAAAR
jgi:hypothetical protein